MRITTDEKGYVTGWSIVGDEEGILCQVPENFDRFAVFYPGFTAWKTESCGRIRKPWRLCRSSTGKKKSAGSGKTNAFPSSTEEHCGMKV